MLASRLPRRASTTFVRRSSSRSNGRRTLPSRSLSRLPREWGITSPPALDVARALNELLELWANVLVEKVGLIKDESEPAR